MPVLGLDGAPGGYRAYEAQGMIGGMGAVHRVGQRAVTGLAATRLGSAFFRIVLPPLDRFTVKASGGRTNFADLVIPTLMLTTTGHRSGRQRQSPLCYLQDGGDLIVVGTNWGQAQHPAWTANLLADPAARVLVGGTTRDVVAVPVEGEDWRRLYPRFESLGRNYTTYLDRAGGRVPRMFRLRPPG